MSGSLSGATVMACVDTHGGVCRVLLMISVSVTCNRLKSETYQRLARFVALFLGTSAVLAAVGFPAGIAWTSPQATRMCVRIAACPCSDSSGQSLASLCALLAKKDRKNLARISLPCSCRVRAILASAALCLSAVRLRPNMSETPSRDCPATAEAEAEVRCGEVQQA